MERDRPRHRWMRRCLIAAGGIVMALAVAALLIKYAVAPALVRSAIRDAVGEYWEGEFAVADVSFSFTGPIVLTDVAARDAEGRRWLAIDQVQLELSDWPGTHPKLTVVNIARPHVRLFAMDGHIAPPWRTPPPGPASPYVDLRRIAATGLEFRIVRGASGGSPEETVVQLDGLRFNLDRRGPVNELSLTRGGDAESAPLSVTAKLDGETGVMDARVILDHQVEPVLVEFIQRLAGAGVRGRAGGGIRVDAKIAGPMKEPLQWKVDGTMSVRDASVSLADGRPLISNVSFDAKLEGQSGRITTGRIVTDAFSVETGRIEVARHHEPPGVVADLERFHVTFAGGKAAEGFWTGLMRGVSPNGAANIRGRVSMLAGDAGPAADLDAEIELKSLVLPTPRPVTLRNVTARMLSLKDWKLTVGGLAADVLDGQLQADGEVQLDRSEPPFRVQLHLDNVNVTALAETLGAGKIRRGLFSGDFVLSGAGLRYEGYTGRGAATLDESDLSGLPILSHALKLAGINPGAGLVGSDLQAAFDVEGAVLKLTAGRIANAVSALEAEPGGTIDLVEQRLDLGLLVVPLRSVNALLGRIPVVNWFANLQKSLVRLSVRGPWDDPPSELVRVQPLEPLAERTLNFLEVAARSGGELSTTLGKGVATGVGDVFRLLPGLGTRPAKDGAR